MDTWLKSKGLANVIPKNSKGPERPSREPSTCEDVGDEGAHWADTSLHPNCQKVLGAPSLPASSQVANQGVRYDSAGANMCTRPSSGIEDSSLHPGQAVPVKGQRSRTSSHDGSCGGVSHMQQLQQLSQVQTPQATGNDNSHAHQTQTAVQQAFSNPATVDTKPSHHPTRNMGLRTYMRLKPPADSCTTHIRQHQHNDAQHPAERDSAKNAKVPAPISITGGCLLLDDKVSSLVDSTAAAAMARSTVTISAASKSVMHRGQKGVGNDASHITRSSSAPASVGSYHDQGLLSYAPASAPSDIGQYADLSKDKIPMEVLLAITSQAGVDGADGIVQLTCTSHPLLPDKPLPCAKLAALAAAEDDLKLISVPGTGHDTDVHQGSVTVACNVMASCIKAEPALDSVQQQVATPEVPMPVSCHDAAGSKQDCSQAFVTIQADTGSKTVTSTVTGNVALAAATAKHLQADQCAADIAGLQRVDNSDRVHPGTLPFTNVNNPSAAMLGGLGSAQGVHLDNDTCRVMVVAAGGSGAAAVLGANYSTAGCSRGDDKPDADGGEADVTQGPGAQAEDAQKQEGLSADDRVHQHDAVDIQPARPCGTRHGSYAMLQVLTPDQDAPSPISEDDSEPAGVQVDQRTLDNQRYLLTPTKRTGSKGLQVSGLPGSAEEAANARIGTQYQAIIPALRPRPSLNDPAAQADLAMLGIRGPSQEEAIKICIEVSSVLGCLLLCGVCVQLYMCAAVTCMPQTKAYCDCPAVSYQHPCYCALWWQTMVSSCGLHLFAFHICTCVLVK